MAQEFHIHEDYSDIQSDYGLSRHFREDLILANILCFHMMSNDILYRNKITIP